jgi:hypothetical protein
MMPSPATIFVDFDLPNPTTWFYFSLLLAVALFVKFSRLLSIRNLDVLSMFLLVPGLLLVLEGGNSASLFLQWLGYTWLLAGSGYFLVRCLLDLILVRRPALSPNLSLGGLAWLSGALFIGLIAIAVRQSNEPPDRNGKIPAPIEQVQRQGQTLMDNIPTAPALDDVHAKIWVERGLALLCHLAIVAGLIVVGCRHFQDAHIGMAAATFYLLLPYTFLLFPYASLKVGQWHHIWPMALTVWAVAVYRRPLLAGMFLGLAAGSVYFPLVLFPVWCGFYWRRGAGRFAVAFVLAAGLSLTATALILWAQGDLAKTVRDALSLSDWQPWKKPTTEGFWLWIDGTAIHWAYRIPVFIAYLALVITTGFWPAPKNLAHVLALSAAVLIGTQFWYADRGGIYVLWYLPLLLLLVFRPNLADRRPPIIPPENDRVAAVGRGLGRLVVRLGRWLLPSPQPVVRVR